MAEQLVNIHDLVGRCPFATSQKLLAGKWSLLIMHELSEGPVRFRELERRLHPITQATLTRALRQMEDALQLTKQELTQFDVVVNATSAFTPDTYHLPADLTLLLVKALANTNTRLIAIGGAGSLYVDEDHTVQLNDTPEFPPEFLVRSKTHAKSDDILRKFSNVDWTMFTPPPILDAEGPESNDYILGNENVILNKEGKPYLSYATFAQILVDEINNHKFGRQRFTAVQN
jgi:uncharacterized protein